MGCYRLSLTVLGRSNMLALRLEIDADTSEYGAAQIQDQGHPEHPDEQEQLYLDMQIHRLWL